MKKLIGVAAAAALALGAASVASADHEVGHTAPISREGITPEFRAGNDSQGELDLCTYLDITVAGAVGGLKVDPPVDTENADVKFTITDGTYISWEFLSPGWQMLAVLVKGGPDHHIYWYNDATIQSDAWLVSPNNEGGNIAGVSHYSFCYGPAETDIELGEWCSPGYWRQEHHLDSWEATGISPTELYSDYFPEGVSPSNKAVKDGASTNPTLWEVLQSPQWYGGEAFNNVGDLLSEAHPDVDFQDNRVEDSCPLS